MSKKIFIYEQSLMNGTVTVESGIYAFTSRELAKQVRDDVRKDNAQRDLGGMRVRYSDIKEIEVYESKDEVLFYQFKG